MNTKYLFRVRNADLFDVDALRVKRQAKKGWLPKSISKSIITLTKGEPTDIDCRFLFYDTAEVSYNRRMTELQQQGWQYVSSDGISQTLLIAPEGTAEPISEPEMETRVIKRHRMAQGIAAFVCFAALIWLVFRFLQQYGKIPMNRLFVCAAVLAYGIQCLSCCISHTRDLITVSGEAGPRKTMAAFIYHCALAAITGVMLVLAIVIAVCYNS